MRNMEVVKFPYGALRAPDYVDVYQVGTTSKAITPPSSGAFACFSADVDFYVNYGTTAVAALPTTADVTNGSGCELNPNTRYVYGTTQINAIAPTTGAVTIAWFRGM